MNEIKRRNDRRRPEFHFQRLVENSSVGLTVVQNGRYLYVNPRFCEIFGYSREEVISRLSPLDVTVESDRSRVVDGMQQRERGDLDTVDYVFKGRRKDGVLIDVQLHGTHMEIDGKFASIASLIDVTQQRRDAAAAIEEKAFSDTAIRSIPGIFFVLDRNLFNVRWNVAFEELLGRSPAEMRALYGLDVVHPDDREHIRATIEDAFEHGAAEAEVRFLAADGTTPTYLVTGRKGEIDGAPYLIGTGIDITRRKHAEDALRLSEARFRSAFEGAGHGIAWVKLDGRFIKVNSALCRMLGYDESELLCRTYQDLTHPDDLETGMQIQQRQLRGELDTIELEKRYIRKDGEIVWALVNAALVRDEHGNPLHAIAQIQNITQRKKAQAENRATAQKLDHALIQTIQAIAATVEKRDPYTAGHQRRVAELARAIGHDLDMPEDRVEGLYMAGLIHDIGKIGVPAEILSKPGRLETAEYALIKMHVEIGYDIVKDIEFPWPVATAIRQHHERLDGSGYPHGLKGDAIGQEGRILAVADVVESMASDRPYRPSKGIGPALAEITKGRGTLYDPAAVDACIGLFRDGRYKI